MKKIVSAFGLMALSLTSVYARDDQSESENEEFMELHQAIEVRKEAFKEAQKNESKATEKKEDQDHNRIEFKPEIQTFSKYETPVNNDEQYKNESISPINADQPTPQKNDSLKVDKLNEPQEQPNAELKLDQITENPTQNTRVNLDQNKAAPLTNADQEKYTEDKTIETEVPQAKKEVETSNLLQKMVKALFSFFQ